MKHYLVFLAVLVLAGACATNQRLSNNGDLIGAWTCISATSDGKPLPEKTVQLLHLTLTADRYKTERGSEVLFDSTYTIDRSKRPHWINMIGTEGDLAGKEGLGIIALENNTLTICYRLPGLPRPETFDSSPGSKSILAVWQRAPKP